MPVNYGVEAAVAATTHLSQGRQSFEDGLAAIASLTRSVVPGFDHVGITTVGDDSRFATVATAGELVWSLDRLQYALGEGPCVDSVRGDARVVFAPNIEDDDRWPEFVPLAVELGLRAQLSIKLEPEGRGTIGSLNLYSTISEDIDPRAESLAQALADRATLALLPDSDIAGLREALDSRKVIGQALGIVMERYQMSEERALDHLVRASSRGNVKLRDVAVQMVLQMKDRC